MGEHDGMTNEELRRLVVARMGLGPVGRILRELERRGEDTSSYQSSRTTEDLERDVRWGLHVGEAKAAQREELRKRGL